MKYPLLSILFLLFLSPTVRAQQPVLESEFMNCLYSSFADKGEQLRKSIQDFEEHLIDEKLLSDNSGESYVALFQKLADDNSMVVETSMNFIDMLAVINEPDDSMLEECVESLSDLKEIDNSKMGQLKDEIAALSDTHSRVEPSAFAKTILKIFEASDFETDFNKMNLFVMFETISYTNDIGIARQLPKEETVVIAPEAAMDIQISAKNEILIDGEIISLDKVKEKCLAHILEHHSEAGFYFTTHRETSYKTYIEVQNEIIRAYGIVRDNKAQELYGFMYIELSEEEKEAVREFYPLRIQEN